MPLIPNNESSLTEITPSYHRPTRGMIRQRAVELAANDGRPEHEVSKTDWVQAKQELNGR